MSDSTDQSNDSKLLGLEVIRFACSFAVLVFHYRHFYQTAGAPAFTTTGQPLYAPLSIFYGFGLYGVQLFWGISGFIFFWKYGAAIAEGAVSAGRFAWLRFTRLYPLHFATLLLVAALQPIHMAISGTPFVYHDDNATQFLLQLGMATQWGPAMPYSFNGPIWSVSAEVLVYALFFFLVGKIQDRMKLCLVMVTASMAALLTGWAQSPVLLCTAYFFAGGLAAEWSARAKPGKRGAERAMLMIGAIALFAWWQADRLLQLGPLLLMVAIIPGLYLAAIDWRVLDRWSTPIQAAGNLTYSTYLCHFPLQLTLAIAVAAAGIVLPVSSPLFLLAYLATTLILGHFVFTRFERPVQQWLRTRAGGRSVAAA